MLTSAHAATINTMKKLTFILVLLVSIAQAQPNITKIEYFIGTDPGFDMADSISGSPLVPDINNFINSIASNLNPGINYIGFRSKDANNVWSHTNFLKWFVVDSSQSKISEVEYFWDVDSGFNSHSDTLFANPIATISNGMLYTNVPLSLSVGTHILFARSRVTSGAWSHTNYVDSVVVDSVITNIVDLNNGSGVSVYPNPFVDKITVEPTNNETIRVMIYTVDGRILIDKVVNQIEELDAQTLSPGTYILNVWTDKKRIYRSTLIKE